MTNICRVVALLVLMVLVAPAAWSQDEPGRVTFQGVSWPSGEGVPKVRPQPTSTGAFFSQTFYRTNEVYQPIEMDKSAFFFRVAQTVQPLAQVGTVEQILEILGNDARGIAAQLGTDEIDIEISECTRTIAGAERSGKAVAGIVLPGLSKPESVMGRYECYAFEVGGKGVGVIVKIATSDEAQQATDEAQAQLFLSSLAVAPVGPMDVYDAAMHGTSFKLPVASAVSNVTQPQQGVGIADVQMQGAQARLIAMYLGETAAASEQHYKMVSQFASDNKAAIENSESATVLCERQLRLATGDGDLRLVNAPIIVYRTPNGPMLNTVLSHYDSIGKYESVTVSLENPELAGAIVRALGIGVQGGMDKIGRRVEQRLLPGFRLSVAQSTGLSREARDGLFEVSPSYYLTGEDRVDVVRAGRSFNAVGVAPEGESLMSLHSAFVTRYHEQNNARGDRPLGTLAEGTIRVEPDASVRIVRPWVRTELACLSEDATLMDHVTVSSAVVEYPGTKRRLVVHNVSPKLLRGIEMGMAEAIIRGATVLGEGERHRVGAMELAGELAGCVWHVSREDLEGTTHYSTMLDGCRVRVTVYDDDPRNGVLSSRLLADRHLRYRFEYFLLEQELRAFRAQPDELVETTIAGRKAMTIQKLYTGKDRGGTGERNETAYMRGYGVGHGNGYTVVMIVQEKEPDDARLDAVAAMFVAPAE